MFSKKVGEIARRSITLKRNFRKGEIIVIDDIDFRRPGNAGISCSEYENIIGKEVLEDIKMDSFLQKNQIKK